MAANQHVWDCWAPLHLKSKFYSVEDFIAGGSSLRSIETSELGDVRDKRLLHLQCHFGLDTLSWARLGADAVGIDNSEVAIDIARRLSVDTGIQADFVCSDLYALPGPLDRDSFDIVFSQLRGTELATGPRALGIGFRGAVEAGRRFLSRRVPSSTRHARRRHGQLASNFPYFGADRKPLVLRDEVSYADPDADQPSHTLYQWIHSLGDVVSALAGAGLTIEWLHEFDYSPYACYPWLHERRHNEYVADFPASTSCLLRQGAETGSLSGHRPTVQNLLVVDGLGGQRIQVDDHLLPIRVHSKPGKPVHDVLGEI